MTTFREAQDAAAAGWLSPGYAVASASGLRQLKPSAGGKGERQISRAVSSAACQRLCFHLIPVVLLARGFEPFSLHTVALRASWSNRRTQEYSILEPFPASRGILPTTQVSLAHADAQQWRSSGPMLPCGGPIRCYCGCSEQSCRAKRPKYDHSPALHGNNSAPARRLGRVDSSKDQE